MLIVNQPQAGSFEYESRRSGFNSRTGHSCGHSVDAVSEPKNNIIGPQTFDNELSIEKREAFQRLRKDFLRSEISDAYLLIALENKLIGSYVTCNGDRSNFINDINRIVKTYLKMGCPESENGRLLSSRKAESYRTACSPAPTVRPPPVPSSAPQPANPACESRQKSGYFPASVQKTASAFRADESALSEAQNASDTQHADQMNAYNYLRSEVWHPDEICDADLMLALKQGQIDLTLLEQLKAETGTQRIRAIYRHITDLYDLKKTLYFAVNKDLSHEQRKCFSQVRDKGYSIGDLSDASLAAALKYQIICPDDDIPGVLSQEQKNEFIHFIQDRVKHSIRKELNRKRACSGEVKPTACSSSAEVQKEVPPTTTPSTGAVKPVTTQTTDSMNPQDTNAGDDSKALTESEEAKANARSRPRDSSFSRLMKMAFQYINAFIDSLTDWGKTVTAHTSPANEEHTHQDPSVSGRDNSKNADLPVKNEQLRKTTPIEPRGVGLPRYHHENTCFINSTLQMLADSWEGSGLLNELRTSPDGVPEGALYNILTDLVPNVDTSKLSWSQEDREKKLQELVKKIYDDPNAVNGQDVPKGTAERVECVKNLIVTFTKLCDCLNRGEGNPELMRKDFINAYAKFGKSVGSKSIASILGDQKCDQVLHKKIPQQDPSEFYMTLTQALGMDQNPASSVKTRDEFRLYKKSGNSLNLKDSKLLSTTTAMEYSIALPLPIQKSNTLQNCIDDYVEEEFFKFKWDKDSLNQFDIQQDSSTSTSKTIRLTANRAPQQLVLQIKLYDNDHHLKALTYSKKKGEALLQNMPNTIDLPITVANEGNSWTCHKIPYRIRSIICHNGVSLNAGHYITLKFDENGQVVVCDDNDVLKWDDYAKKNNISCSSWKELCAYKGLTPYFITVDRVDE